MKKNIFMTILIAATAVAMIVGILWHVTGTIHPGRGGILVEAAGEKDVEIRKNENEVIKAETADETEKTAFDSAETVKAASESAETEKTSEITTLHIDMNIGDIIVREGESLKVAYNGDKKYEPKVEQDGSSLTIIQPDTRNSFNLKSVFNIKSINAKLTVTLPGGNTLSDLDIVENLGDIELSGITAEKVTINNDLGDISCEECSLGNAVVLSSMGDVNVKDCSFENLDINQDLGDVNVSTPESLSGVGLDLETDLGSVKVNGKDQGTRFDLERSDGIQLTVKNAMGDIKVTWAE